MKDFVSSRRISVVKLAAPMSVVWLVFVLQGFPWTGLVCVSLVAFSAALWLDTNSTQSIAQVIADTEAAPGRAVAAPGPAAVAVPKAVL